MTGRSGSLDDLLHALVADADDLRDSAASHAGGGCFADRLFPFGLRPGVALCGVSEARLWVHGSESSLLDKRAQLCL
jgi:hypothetical protein